MLSIMGMYSYDDSIFDGLEVPEGLVKQDVIDEVCLQCGELEVIYPDTDTMKRAIAIWSKGNKIAWEKLYNTMTIEYNPIWNVDGDVTDTETITGNRGITRNSTGNNTRSVKGFNSNTWSEAEKNDVSADEDVSEDNETVREYHQRRTGNIGVTTTQKMLTEEREIAKFNLINYIVQSFKLRFCLLVY